MGSPGKIAFPVILALGAITGYITYTSFTAAIPEEERIDSPYYQPLSPASGGGGPTINILEGAAVQGSPDYDPDELTAKKGDEVTVVNQDTVPHTATSGTGATDPNSAKSFDTSIINGGESATISLAQVEPGQYDYYCMIHPYMTGKITIG